MEDAQELEVFRDLDPEPAITFPDVAREEDRLQALAEPPFS